MLANPVIIFPIYYYFIKIVPEFSLILYILIGLLLRFSVWKYLRIL